MPLEVPKRFTCKHWHTQNHTQQLRLTWSFTSRGLMSCLNKGYASMIIRVRSSPVSQWVTCYIARQLSATIVVRTDVSIVFAAAFWLTPCLRGGTVKFAGSGDVSVSRVAFRLRQPVGGMTAAGSCNGGIFSESSVLMLLLVTRPTAFRALFADFVRQTWMLFVPRVFGPLCCIFCRVYGE